MLYVVSKVFLLEILASFIVWTCSGPNCVNAIYCLSEAVTLCFSLLRVFVVFQILDVAFYTYWRS